PGRRPDERQRGKIFSTLCHAAATGLRQAAEDANNDDDAFAISCRLMASRLIEAQAEALEKGQFENPFADAFRFDRYRLPPSSRLRADEEPDVVWDALQRTASEPRRSWLEVFERAIEQDDHLATGAVLPLAQPLAAVRHLDVERVEAIDHA